MKSSIELKHVGPRAHVRGLLEALIARLEEKLGHFPPDALSLRVVFEAHRSRTLFRTSLTCHLPGHLAAAHVEHQDAGTAIRRAFAEIGRQVEKEKASLRHEHGRRHARAVLRAARG